ncbi:MAG: GH3 auxin-responsive promoter family protein [Bacteriovoracaceae bacterium]
MLRIAHEAMSHFYQKSYARFLSEMPHFKSVQENKLKHIDQEIYSYQEFVKKFPLTTYSDYEIQIKKMRSDGNIKFHPTSGSTHERKWIPYTDALKKEFDAGVSPWLGDLYRSFPKIKLGKHYWSLSWLPNDLRQSSSCNDVDILPWWKQEFLKRIMAVPSQVQYQKTSEESIISSLTYLCSCPDLALISIWSPTYLLSFLDCLQSNKDEVSCYLSKGKWSYSLPCPKNPKQADILAHSPNVVDSHFLQELWPQLGLISSWDTGSSQHWSQKLRELFSHCSFQGKALLTTEAVITIPFHNLHLLAYQGHFFEFIDQSNNEVLPSWELRPGMKVTPVVSTGSGFLRYKIPDLLYVEQFYKGLPVLRFLGRMRDIDMVGEKISPEVAEICMQGMKEINKDICPISLIAVEGERKSSYYCMLIEGDETTNLSSYLEKLLKTHYHYSVARDLNQLSEAKVVITPKARSIYQALFENRGMVSGEIKIEPLCLVKEIELIKELS